ncbi:SCO2583/SCO2584 N-terminal domain-containing protein [Streptomyces flavalbus]|uniref:Integral membrane protein n=1 Tax=Streptomyces flavalbus TaxID=2665155 RepID=A0ABW2W533_9ACTN
MSEQGDSEREFDIKWADEAVHKEPSARARMLAERWKHDPPGPVPFRPEPDGRRHGRRLRGRGSGRIRGERSPWVSVVIVFGFMATVILLLGYADFRG